MNKTLQKAIRVEYTMLRAPLALLDQRVVSRLDAHSKLRATVAQGLHMLDAAATRLLEAPTRPDLLPTDEQEEVEQLTDELLAQQEDKPFVGELADDEPRRVQAELRAKHLVEEEHGTGR